MKTPLHPALYIGKLEFTLFSYFCSKNRLRVPVKTASLRIEAVLTSTHSLCFYQNISSENYHFYRREISHYIIWKCYLNGKLKQTSKTSRDRNCSIHWLICSPPPPQYVEATTFRKKERKKEKKKERKKKATAFVHTH